MNASEFEAQLKADGYQEIESQELVPRPGKGRTDIISPSRAPAPMRYFTPGDPTARRRDNAS